MKKARLFMIITSLIILIISFIGSKGELVENLEIPIGVGADVEKSAEDFEYATPLLITSLREDRSISSDIIVGKAKSIGETREKRQLKSGKRVVLGLSRIFIHGEYSAQTGIRNFMDIILNNPDINDRCVSVVCKGRAEDVLKYKPDGYPNSAEYIENMVRNAVQYNFFPMQYTITDIIVRIDAEGRNLLLPYVEILDDSIKTTGLAVFKKDKMVAKTNIEEARVINILKENDVKGILTLQEDSKRYINFYATSKRKIKCYKENGKYKFEINLNINGNILSNQLYKNINKDSKEIKKFQEDMSAHVKKICSETMKRINEKYQVDVLDLGRVAAAKYGRGTGVDWDKIISDSEIIINAKVKVDSEGRGDY